MNATPPSTPSTPSTPLPGGSAGGPRDGTWTVIGMLSGTSHDAVDAAVADLRFEGREIVLRTRGLHSEPYPDALRQRIIDCLPPAETTIERVCQLDTGLGRFFGAVAARANAELAGSAADLVVSHGQTLYHWVERGQARGTLQLGGAAWIAEATGLPVVADLRSADIARGGQGAPLAATLDALLLLREHPRRGALNLGGIANLTVPGERAAVLAYDLGPAGALIDAVAARASSGAETMDVGGARAACGTVDAALLARLLAEPYYRLPPPKSTGKELFDADYLLRHLDAREPVPAADDLAATVTELTARLVAHACREHRLDELVVSGGGVRNPVLMARVSALCAPTRVARSEEHGLPAQAKEAYLFALLGFLSVHGLAGALPSATGARGGAVLGSLTPGARPLRLPVPRRAAPTRLRVEPGDQAPG